MAIVFRKTLNPSTLVDLNQLLPVLRDPVDEYVPTQLDIVLIVSLW